MANDWGEPTPIDDQKPANDWGEPAPILPDTSTGDADRGFTAGQPQAEWGEPTPVASAPVTTQTEQAAPGQSQDWGEPTPVDDRTARRIGAIAEPIGSQDVGSQDWAAERPGRTWDTFTTESRGAGEDMARAIQNRDLGGASQALNRFNRNVVGTTIALPLQALQGGVQTLERGLGAIGDLASPYKSQVPDAVANPIFGLGLQAGAADVAQRAGRTIADTALRGGPDAVARRLEQAWNSPTATEFGRGKPISTAYGLKNQDVDVPGWVPFVGGSTFRAPIADLPDYAAGLALDPTNYIGLGVGKSLGKGLIGGGVRALDTFADAPFRGLARVAGSEKAGGLLAAGALGALGLDMLGQRFDRAGNPVLPSPTKGLTEQLPEQYRELAGLGMIAGLALGGAAGFRVLNTGAGRFLPRAATVASGKELVKDIGGKPVAVEGYRVRESDGAILDKQGRVVTDVRQAAPSEIIDIPRRIGILLRHETGTQGLNSVNLTLNQIREAAGDNPIRMAGALDALVRTLEDNPGLVRNADELARVVNDGLTRVVTTDGTVAGIVSPEVFRSWQGQQAGGLLRRTLTDLAPDGNLRASLNRIIERRPDITGELFASEVINRVSQQLQRDLKIPEPKWSLAPVRFVDLVDWLDWNPQAKQFLDLHVGKGELDKGGKLYTQIAASTQGNWFTSPAKYQAAERQASRVLAQAERAWDRMPADVQAGFRPAMLDPQLRGANINAFLDIMAGTKAVAFAPLQLLLTVRYPANNLVGDSFMILSQLGPQALGLLRQETRDRVRAALGTKASNWAKPGGGVSAELAGARQPTEFLPPRRGPISTALDPLQYTLPGGRVVAGVVGLPARAGRGFAELVGKLPLMNEAVRRDIAETVASLKRYREHYVPTMTALYRTAGADEVTAITKATAEWNRLMNGMSDKHWSAYVDWDAVPELVRDLARETARTTPLDRYPAVIGPAISAFYDNLITLAEALPHNRASAFAAAMATPGGPAPTPAPASGPAPARPAVGPSPTGPSAAPGGPPPGMRPAGPAPAPTSAPTSAPTLSLNRPARPLGPQAAWDSFVGDILDQYRGTGTGRPPQGDVPIGPDLAPKPPLERFAEDLANAAVTRGWTEDQLVAAAAVYQSFADEFARRTGRSADEYYAKVRFDTAENVKDVQPGTQFQIDPSRVMENPAFREWFRGSQVVDETGAPKVMYHGTGKGGFAEFDLSKTSPEGLYGRGFYFTDDPSIGSSYVGKERPDMAPVTPEAVINQRIAVAIDQPGAAEAFARWARENDPRLKSTVITRRGQVDELTTRFADIFQQAKAFDALSREQKSMLVAPSRDYGPDGPGIADYLSNATGVDVARWAGQQLRQATGEQLYPVHLAVRDPMDMRVGFDAPGVQRDVQARIERLKGADPGAYDLANRAYRDVLDDWAKSRELDAFSNSSFPDMTPAPPSRAPSLEEFYQAMRIEAASDARVLGRPWDVVSQAVADRVTSTIRAMGYDGISHIGGRQMGQVDHNVWIAFEPNQVKSATGNVGTFSRTSPDIRFQADQAYRGDFPGGSTDLVLGQTRTLDTGRMDVTFFKDANLSTVLHEGYHTFDGFMRQNADVYADELAALDRTYTGPKAGEDAARAFERYMREGKAPTPALQRAFEAIKNWMVEIYQKIIGSPIEVRLTNEVREAFQTMLGGPKFTDDVRLRGSFAGEGLQGATWKRVAGTLNRLQGIPETTKSAQTIAASAVVERIRSELGLRREGMRTTVGAGETRPAFKRAYDVAVKGGDEAAMRELATVINRYGLNLDQIAVLPLPYPEHLSSVGKTKGKWIVEKGGQRPVALVRAEQVAQIEAVLKNTGIKAYEEAARAADILNNPLRDATPTQTTTDVAFQRQPQTGDPTPHFQDQYQVGPNGQRPDPRPIIDQANLAAQSLRNDAMAKQLALGEAISRLPEPWRSDPSALAKAVSGGRRAQPGVPTAQQARLGRYQGTVLPDLEPVVRAYEAYNRAVKAANDAFDQAMQRGGLSPQDAFDVAAAHDVLRDIPDPVDPGWVDGAGSPYSGPATRTATGWADAAGNPIRFTNSMEWALDGVPPPRQVFTALSNRAQGKLTDLMTNAKVPDTAGRFIADADRTRARADASAYAQREGFTDARATLFGYDDRTAGQYVLDHFSPYSYWTMNHMATMGRYFASHPGPYFALMSILRDWAAANEDERGLNKFSVFLWRTPDGEEVRLRPHQYFPFATQGIGEIIEPFSEARSPWAQALVSMMRIFGVSLHTPLDWAMNAATTAGAGPATEWYTGPRGQQWTRPFTPQGDLLNKILKANGIDFDPMAGPRQALYGESATSRGQSRFGTDDYYTGLELARLTKEQQISAQDATRALISLREGAPNDLWRRAERAAMGDRARQALISYFGIPLGYTPAERERVDQLSRDFYGQAGPGGKLTVLPREDLRTTQARQDFRKANPDLGVKESLNDDLTKLRYGLATSEWIEGGQAITEKYKQLQLALDERANRGQITGLQWRDERKKLQEQERTERATLEQRTAADRKDKGKNLPGPVLAPSEQFIPTDAAQVKALKDVTDYYYALGNYGTDRGAQVRAQQEYLASLPPTIKAAAEAIIYKNETPVERYNRTVINPLEAKYAAVPQFLGVSPQEAERLKRVKDVYEEVRYAAGGTPASARAALVKAGLAANDREAGALYSRVIDRTNPERAKLRGSDEFAPYRQFYGQSAPTAASTSAGTQRGGTGSSGTSGSSGVGTGSGAAGNSSVRGGAPVTRADIDNLWNQYNSLKETDRRAATQFYYDNFDRLYAGSRNVPERPQKPPSAEQYAARDRLAAISQEYVRLRERDTRAAGAFWQSTATERAKLEAIRDGRPVPTTAPAPPRPTGTTGAVPRSGGGGGGGGGAPRGGSAPVRGGTAGVAPIRSVIDDDLRNQLSAYYSGKGPLPDQARLMDIRRRYSLGVPVNAPMSVWLQALRRFIEMPIAA